MQSSSGCWVGLLPGACQRLCSFRLLITGNDEFALFKNEALKHDVMMDVDEVLEGLPSKLLSHSRHGSHGFLEVCRTTNFFPSSKKLCQHEIFCLENLP